LAKKFSYCISPLGGGNFHIFSQNRRFCNISKPR